MSFRKNPPRDIMIKRGNTSIVINSDDSIDVIVDGTTQVTVDQYGQLQVHGVKVDTIQAMKGNGVQVKRLINLPNDWDL